MNKHRRSLAFLLTLALILTFPAFAFAAPITGDSTVIDVPVNVVLPTNLDFALDPLGIDSADNQISSPDFIMANQTLAPVKVEIEITANVVGETTLVDDPSVLARDDDEVTAKNIFFAAMGATDVSAGSIYTIAEDVVAPTAIATAPGIYDYSETATRAVFDPVGDGKTSGSAVIGFVLDRAVASATEGAIQSMAADDKGVAMFRFYGELNTYADWQDGDIDVEATINLTPLRTSTYGNLTDAVDGVLIAEGVNQIELVAPEQDPEPVQTDVTLTAGTPTASYNFNLPEKFGGATPGLKIALTGAAGTTITSATWGTGVNVASYMTLADGVVTFNAVEWASNETYAATLTIAADGKTYTITTLTGTQP